MSNDEWATPPWLFDKLNAEFHFDLDVCATAANSKCKAYWSKESDALKMIWCKTNWCNPPYSNQMPWGQKAFSESLRGNITVMLAMCDTSTQFFKYRSNAADEIRLLDRRVQFVGAKGSPRFASMIVVFRPPETNPLFQGTAVIKVVSYRDELSSP